MTVVAFTGGESSPEQRAERARQTRVLAFVRRAVANEGGDCLVLLSNVSREPVGLFQLAPADKSAEPAQVAQQVAQEVLAAISEEADLSRATSFRLCVQSGDQTAASITIRVRDDHNASPLESHLKHAGETSEGALVRQLMRHSEGMARLLVESTERRAAADQKVFDRLAKRLEELEEQRDRVDAQSVTRMRAEAELVREMASEDRRALLERQAMAQLLPALPRLVARFLGENPPNSGGATPAPGPSNSAEKAPVASVAAAPPPASAQNSMGGEARPSSAEVPPPMNSAPPSAAADRVLSILAGMPADAVEIMAEFLAGEGKAAEAAEVRAAYAAHRKDATK